jgi:hypothetical protein
VQDVRASWPAEASGVYDVWASEGDVKVGWSFVRPDRQVRMDIADAWGLLTSLRSSSIEVEQWKVDHALVAALVDVDERLRKLEDA